MFLVLLTPLVTADISHIADFDITTSTATRTGFGRRGTRTRSEIGAGERRISRCIHEKTVVFGASFPRPDKNILPENPPQKRRELRKISMPQADRRFELRKG